MDSYLFNSLLVPTGENVGFPQLPDVLLVDGDFLLLLRLRRSQSLPTDQRNENGTWRGEYTLPHSCLLLFFFKAFPTHIRAMAK